MPKRSGKIIIGCLALIGFMVLLGWAIGGCGACALIGIGLSA